MQDKNQFQEVETFSVATGMPLFQLPIRTDILDQQQTLYIQALNNFKKNSEDPDNIIWLGRRTAYLGRYREAIAIFSLGIQKFPNDPRMYRHRGHRFITLRHFKLAIEDFSKAAILIQGRPDEIEPDGLPNDRGIPVSTLHFNIWYHLGLTYYLEARYEKALEAYQRCLDLSDIPDKYVAVAHWLYMTLRLLDRNKEADKILEKVTSDLDIIENQVYHKCLLMYKGEVAPKTLLKEARRSGSLNFANIGYGIANWYKYNNQLVDAKKVLTEILSTDIWVSFGYIAAEVDTKRVL